MYFYVAALHDAFKRPGTACSITRLPYPYLRLLGAFLPVL